MHSKLATRYASLIDHACSDDNHNMTCRYVALTILVYKTIFTILNENDARLYEPFVSRIYMNLNDDDKVLVHRMWVNACHIIGIQVPTVAADHIEQFLDYTFKKKDTSRVGVLLLGHRIWRNVYQMSGVDSLFDKSTAAIHQSLCLLVLVTPKYMRSIDCQRELSLANTLHKPILPLLLDEIHIRPPADLVLSLFLEKSYIDFRHSNVHGRWTEKQFHLLLSQLQQLTPNVQTNKPRHLLEMRKPTSASRHNGHIDQRPRRIFSAPIIPRSQACSLM
ncbi:unnamed protein product [Rotaria socialis]|uniref:TIR domain-containing protein n=1 Tax=Rotaria socialis TaxID=392032 RepID=A0A818FMI9_9BILA|nr:unnamed protein product [Rotaria socialis]